MKKLLTLFLAAGMTLSAAHGASAVELKVSGMYDFAFGWGANRVMGGGTFGNVSRTNKTAEFNIWVDPRAAAEVFAQMEVWMVGLNATHAAAVEMSDFAEMIAIWNGGLGIYGAIIVTAIVVYFFCKKRLK